MNNNQCATVPSVELETLSDKLITITRQSEAILELLGIDLNCESNPGIQPKLDLLRFNSDKIINNLGDIIVELQQKL